MRLEVDVDRDVCMGSGHCVHDAPGAFHLDGDGIAAVGDPNTVPEDIIIAVARRCPTGAIAVCRGGEDLL